jgi:hypothetical protein
MCQLIRSRVRHAGCKEKSRFGIVVSIGTTAGNRAGMNLYHACCSCGCVVESESQPRLHDALHVRERILGKAGMGSLCPKVHSGRACLYPLVLSPVMSARLTENTLIRLGDASVKANMRLTPNRP